MIVNVLQYRDVCPGWCRVRDHGQATAGPSTEKFQCSCTTSTVGAFHPSTETCRLVTAHRSLLPMARVLPNKHVQNNLLFPPSSISDRSTAGVQSIQKGGYFSFRSSCTSKGEDNCPRTLHCSYSGSSSHVRRC